ncbi:MAG: hypothetical protein IKL76_02385 [Clostridia bacterium]|nr:hypothetical protein [Clostridia bacterium]
MKKKLLMLSCLLAVSAFAVGCDDEVAHTHSFAKDWTTSETEHWHVASCEHNTEVSDKANHVDADKDGDCDVCAYEIGTKGYVNEAVANAVAKASTINGAKIAIDSDADHDAIVYYTYEIGADAVKLTRSGVAFDDDKSSHAYDDVYIYSDFDGEAFGAVETATQDGENTTYTYSRIPSAYVQTGANTAVALPGSYLYMEEDFVTTEAVLAKLWEIASANANGACEYAVDGDVYSFNADYMEYDGTYYISANVEFTLANDGSLATAVVELEGYYAEDVAENEDAEAPAVLNKYALADFHKYFIIEQTAGEKTYTAPEKATDKMLIESFEIAYAEMSSDPYSPPTNYGFVTDTALAMTVAQTEMMFAFYADNTANIMADEPIDMSNEVVTIEVAGDYDVDYEYDEGTFSIVVNEPTVGTDKIAVTVSTEKASKTIYFTATRPVIESLSVKSSKGNQVSSVNGFAGLEYTFSAVAMPTGAEPAYSVACNVTEGVTLTDNGDGTWTFKATTAGAYELTFKSDAKNASDEDVTAVVAITLAELPNPQTLVDKTKQYKVQGFDYENYMATINYTDDWKVGKLSIANFCYGSGDYGYLYGDVVLNYVYSETTGEFTTTVDETLSSAEFVASLTGDYMGGSYWDPFRVGSKTVSWNIGFNADRTALVLSMQTYVDYDEEYEGVYGVDGFGNGYGDSATYELSAVTVYDAIASAWANSTIYDANDVNRDGYIYMDSDVYKANVMLNADQTGRLAVENEGSVIQYSFNYSVEQGTNGYTVTITDLAHYDPYGWNPAHADNAFVTYVESVYTLSGSVTLASDFSTLTIGSTVFALYQNA